MSKIEVNAIEPQCGTTLTLGASGDTVTLASGASQSGFGRTGTVDWQTGSIKTATFTAVSGEGYFCNTAGGAFELDLPAGSAGAIVSLQDYNNTFDTNALTVDPNGSEKINGGAAGQGLTLETEGLGITFVYIDSTVGWRSVQSNEFTTPGLDPTYIVATGGTITTDGDYKVHTFTSPGTFTVCSVGNPVGSTTVDYMVVAAGGGGAVSCAAGGGGAGGFRESSGAASGCYTRSPLGACVSALPVTATSFPITVGGGGGAAPGSPRNQQGSDGNNSVFSTITATGGGGGGGSPNTPCTASNGRSGGSGGGGGHGNGTGGSGNTPPVAPPQGNNGRNFTSPIAGDDGGGGGGGATSAADTENEGGAGGTTSISGSSTAYAGGGGGGARCKPGSYSTAGGTGGGGRGGFGPRPAPVAQASGVAGTANTGGGGGGATAGPGMPYCGTSSGAGGSGIVIIRVPGSTSASVAPGTNSIATLPAPAGGCKVATFTVSGTLTI